MTADEFPSLTGVWETLQDRRIQLIGHGQTPFSLLTELTKLELMIHKARKRFEDQELVMEDVVIVPIDTSRPEQGFFRMSPDAAQDLARLLGD